MKQKYTREQKLEVIKLHNEGYNARQIAEKLNMTESYVRKVCLMPHMVDKDINTPRKKITNEEIIEIVLSRKKNVSIFQIAQKLNRSATCIENIYRNYKAGKYDFLMNLYETTKKKEEQEEQQQQQQQEEQEEQEEQETFQATVYTQNENDMSIIKQHLDILFDVVKDLQKKYEELKQSNE